MKFLDILCCAIPVISPLTTRGAEFCSDVKSMTDVLDSTVPTLAHAFALTGTVHSVSGAAFVLDDGSLLTTVLNLTDPAVVIHEGNLVAASGNFGLKKFAHGNEPYAVARQIEILGVGSPTLPVRRTLQNLSSSRDNLRLVETEGTVIDYRPDDADPDYLLMILKDGPTTMPVSIPSRDTAPLDAMIDARISVVGTFNRTIHGVRRYSKPSISSDLRHLTLREPPPSPDRVPLLERKLYLTPNDILSLGKRKITGEIVAVWRRHNLLLRDDDARIVRVRLSPRNRLAPRAGERATICGYPETDQFNIILGTATITSANPSPAPRTPETVPLLSSASAYATAFDPSSYGQLVKIVGTIRNLPSLGNAEGLIGLDCNGQPVHLDASSCPDATEGLELGSTIEATGVCLFEMNDYDAQTDTPHISGLSLVLRGKEDVAILSRPPWLTPMRFSIVLGALLGVLFLILVWNASLRILVERRGRELARKQAETLKAKLKTAERTRLATELHDAVVQNLTGAALEIRAALASLGESDSEALPHMDIALKTINASRAELRNCIWDLRNQALEEKNVDEAIRITLQPHLADTRLQVRFNVPRRKIPDNEFHNIISIIRELVVNAVRHGQAGEIRIAGALDRDRILFSVTDDGCGFDPQKVPGMEQGHFGIEGVRERAKALDGTAVIDSAPGAGTRVSVSVALTKEIGQ